jgi:hypothetical protein
MINPVEASIAEMGWQMHRNHSTINVMNRNGCIAQIAYVLPKTVAKDTKAMLG